MNLTVFDYCIDVVTIIILYDYIRQNTNVVSFSMRNRIKPFYVFSYVFSDLLSKTTGDPVLPFT